MWNIKIVHFIFYCWLRSVDGLLKLVFQELQHDTANRVKPQNYWCCVHSSFSLNPISIIIMFYCSFCCYSFFLLCFSFRKITRKDFMTRSWGVFWVLQVFFFCCFALLVGFTAAQLSAPSTPPLAGNSSHLVSRVILFHSADTAKDFP